MTASRGQHLFLVGTGRCGSSISYSCLAMHPEFAWTSTWLTVAPAFPGLSVVNRVWSLPALDRFRETRFFPKPSELDLVFRRWDPRFRVEDSSPEALASAQRGLPTLVDRICRAQGRTRFLGKTVGRPVKVEALARAFPDAQLVHVVRPLRPSTASLLQVEFYDAQALERWPWRPIPPPYLEFYRSRGRPREIAAAIVVKTNMLELERQLAHVERERRLELRYADFVADPVGWIRTVGAHAGFPVDDRFVARVLRRRIFAGADEKWRAFFSKAEHRNLDDFDALPTPPPV